MHLLHSVSMLPSLQEIIPLPLSRVYSPLYSASQLGRGQARICSSPAPPSRVFYPPMCPSIAERLQRQVGWEGHRQLEFVNVGAAPLIIRPGIFICQIISEQVTEPFTHEGEFQAQKSD